MTNSNPIANSTHELSLGSAFDGTQSINGWMDEVRFSNGIARWTGNFTPPVSEYTSTSTPTPTPTATMTPTPTATHTPTATGPAPFSSATFVYDGDGKRVKPTLNGTQTTYFVGNYYEVTGSSITKYYYAGSQRIAMSQDGALSFILGDHLGSTSLVTDAAGHVVSEMRYTAWGEVRYASETPPTDYTYTGQYSDSYINLLWYGSRHYDPYLNHFTQPDSIVPDPNNSQSWDRYAYARNNPIRYNDPSGHRECEPDSKGNCMGVRKLKLWQYAADTLNELGGRGEGKNSLEAMARIIDKAARLYGTFDTMMPELSEIFLGVHESNPLTLLNAAGANRCGALGRAHKDCASNTDAAGFSDTGFNRDFQDSYNQVFHFWAYVATTASTDMPIGGYALGYYIGQAGNYVHENLAIGDEISGATWQDWALAQAGMNTGAMISFGAISPNELGDYIRDNVGANSVGAPYVNPLIRFFPLLGNMKPLW